MQLKKSFGNIIDKVQVMKPLQNEPNVLWFVSLGKEKTNNLKPNQNRKPHMHTKQSASSHFVVLVFFFPHLPEIIILPLFFIQLIQLGLILCNHRIIES